MKKLKNWQGKYILTERDNYCGERWHVRLRNHIEDKFDEKIPRIYKF